MLRSLGLRYSDPPATEVAPKLQAALVHMAQASEYARDVRRNAWDFALGIESLVALGVTESDLRWLVSKGYVEHACEITRSCNAVRRFRPSRSLAFPKKTCFVLTDAGALAAATLSDGPDTLPLVHAQDQRGPSTSGQSVILPHWDSDDRVVRVGQCIVKRYRVPAPNQEAILAAFQEEGWPPHIYDPLSPQADQDPKCRLHDTIKRLNRHHIRWLLRFAGDGTGERVCWAFVGAAAPTLLGIQQSGPRSAPDRPQTGRKICGRLNGCRSSVLRFQGDKSPATFI